MDCYGGATLPLSIWPSVGLEAEGERAAHCMTMEAPASAVSALRVRSEAWDGESWCLHEARVTVRPPAAPTSGGIDATF